MRLWKVMMLHLCKVAGMMAVEPICCVVPWILEYLLYEYIHHVLHAWHRNSCPSGCSIKDSHQILELQQSSTCRQDAVWMLSCLRLFPGSFPACSRIAKPAHSCPNSMRKLRSRDRCSPRGALPLAASNSARVMGNAGHEVLPGCLRSLRGISRFGTAWKCLRTAQGNRFARLLS